MNALANRTQPRDCTYALAYRPPPLHRRVPRPLVRPADGQGPIRSVSGTRSAAGTRTGEGLLGHARILAPTLPFTHHNE